jgi:nitroimidazol reductase NimA-like FMN-containing flavoprotein (pyridoxamine 5'-phosphate oxidase superfamily)
MDVVKLPKMSKDEVEKLITTQNMCRIAFNGPNYPYLIPFRYIRSNDILYFHFTEYGKKMKLMERDNKVCVQIESYKPDLSQYNFVSIRGTLERVDDLNEYNKAIALLRETGKKSSPKFLAAHGIDPSKGWDEFNEEKDLVIVKLVDIVEKVGLKEP